MAKVAWQKTQLAADLAKVEAGDLVRFLPEMAKMPNLYPRSSTNPHVFISQTDKGTALRISGDGCITPPAIIYDEDGKRLYIRLAKPDRSGHRDFPANNSCADAFLATARSRPLGNGVMILSLVRALGGRDSFAVDATTPEASTSHWQGAKSATTEIHNSLERTRG